MARSIGVAALVALAPLATTALGADLKAFPSRELLLRPAPNPAWNQFSVAPDHYGVYPISDGVYMFVYRGTNSLFMVTDEGVIVVDPISEPAAPKYLAAIRDITDAPIRYLVYSHWHWDHIEGGQVFKDAGARILAHDKCIAPLIDLPNPKVVMPDEVFYGTHTIELGGRSLELVYLGPNHSSCLVFPKPDNVNALFIVDMLTPGGAPSSTLMDFIPHHWIRTLREIEAMDLDFIMSGHAVPVAHPSAVTERRVYAEILLEAVRTAGERRMGDQERLAYVRAQLEPVKHMRNFGTFLDYHVRRIATYLGTGW
jgi:glyoxylase-like metal-dependent hydrolase (beta-lactamase superfamily II)